MPEPTTSAPAAAKNPANTPRHRTCECRVKERVDAMGQLPPSWAGLREGVKVPAGGKRKLAAVQNTPYLA